MNRITLPINEIIVENRQREDLGDIQELAESLRRFGIIQPIVISQDRRLLAGGRRLAAATLLGWKEIDVTFKETITSDEAYEIELEENIRRKDMDWQEKVKNVATIHEHKRRRGALAGEGWSITKTSEMLDISRTHIHYYLTIAKYLAADPEKKTPIWKCTDAADAWRYIMRLQEDAALAELARRQQEATFEAYTNDLPDVSGRESEAVEAVQSERDEARERYLSNPLNDPDKFDSYWEEKQKLNAARLEVRLSNRILHGDSIEKMSHPDWAGVFDAIITDIPYGNDMANLDTIRDIDTVEELHEVDYVRNLMTRFFPAAFAVLKEHAFLVTWCDQELWQFMYDLARSAGFKVQRWPIVWNKLHGCQNNAAQYNYTKATEIAMVCRKGNATLVEPARVNYVSAANDDLCDAIGHPFAKPVDAWRFLIDYVTIERQLILEPFAGRGSGVITMLGAERNVIAVEKDTAHYNALLENVKQLHYLKINPNFIFT